MDKNILPKWEGFYIFLLQFYMNSKILNLDMSCVQNTYANCKWMPMKKLMPIGSSAYEKVVPINSMVFVITQII